MATNRYGVHSGVVSGEHFVVNKVAGAPGPRIFAGSKTTRDTVRAELGVVTSAIGSIYLSTAGKIYVKVANAGATTDWEKVTSSAAD